MEVTASRTQILCVVGARPNFMKIAPIIRAFKDPACGIAATLLHTGQHYDAAMKHAFFQQLHIPEPDIDLGVGSGSHAAQTAEIMKKFEPVLDQLKPRAVLVVGDVNSTIACALVAVKKHIPVLHVEAGLRSGDRTMPEEINRVLTDQISDLLFTTERAALDNLLREGIPAERVIFSGNVMIDTLQYNLGNAIAPEQTLAGLVGEANGFDPRRGFGLLTLHRPSNVDDPVTLRRLLEVLARIGQHLPLVFPVHPRTSKCIESAGLSALIAAPNIVVLPPLGYLEMLGLMKEARLVLTDSGGIQEETTALGVPCITLRESTERPITVSEGTNTIVGSDPELIFSCYQQVTTSGGKTGRIPELWDGKAAQRIAATIKTWLAGSC